MSNFQPDPSPIALASTDGIQPDPTHIDHAAIFSSILARQALRIEAKLPRLDIRAEYEHVVAVVEWQIHVDRYHDHIQAEILERKRSIHGDDWPSSFGGRMVLAILTEKTLRSCFRPAVKRASLRLPDRL